MRTKTPQQITRQAKRLTRAIHRQPHNPESAKRLDRVLDTYQRYIYNIFEDAGNDAAEALVKTSEIWHNAATPANIYTKQITA